MKPELDLSGSSLSLIPDNVKVKKTLNLYPLPFILGGTLIWHLETNTLKYKLNCKDQIIGGKVSVDVRDSALEYRKRISLPVAGLRIGCFIIGARVRYVPETLSLKPSCHVGFEVHQGAKIVQLNKVKVKPRLFYRNIGIEARTEFSIQVPKQLLFEFSGSGAAQQRAEQEDGDAWGVKLDIKEINVVLRL